MDVNEKAIKMHEEWGGKIEVIATAPVGSKEELAIAYTPGVAAFIRTFFCSAERMPTGSRPTNRLPPSHRSRKTSPVCSGRTAISLSAAAS